MNIEVPIFGNSRRIVKIIMLQDISPAKVDTYFEHGTLTEYLTTLGPPPLDKFVIQYAVIQLAPIRMRLSPDWPFIMSNHLSPLMH